MTKMDGSGQDHGVIREFCDPLTVARRVIDQALALIPSADGAVLELADQGQSALVCAGGVLAERVGTRFEQHARLPSLAIRTGETLYCEDCACDSRVDPEACRRVGAASIVCAPVRRGKEAIGVLIGSAPEPGAFTAEDVATLASLADLASVAIGAASEVARTVDTLFGNSAGSPAAPEVPDSARMGEFTSNALQPGIAAEAATRARIERLLADRAFKIVCQPIVDLDTGELFGAEALARFNGQPTQPPDVWFAEAHRVGLGVQLELAAAKMALELLDELPETAFLAINFGPSTITAGDLHGLLASVGCDRVVIELTEHLKIDDYPEIRSILTGLRQRGARLAIDDVGAGFASLSHIVNLAPDLIKLDRDFTRGIDLDPARRTLAQVLLGFADETGAGVIAEGIETEAELQTVREVGIPYGQGYAIRPAGTCRIDARAIRTCRRQISDGALHDPLGRARSRCALGLGLVGNRVRLQWRAPREASTERRKRVFAAAIDEFSTPRRSALGSAG